MRIPLSMMAKRTATTANAILGLLALRPKWSTWDLTKQLRRNMRFFWPRAESRIYEEARALADQGLSRATKTSTGRRKKTIYSTTAKGTRELERWLATPPKPTALECEPLLRIFLGKLGTRAQMHLALDQVRADADGILDVGRVVAAEYLAGTAPFQDHVEVRAFVFDFLSNYAMTLIEWADRTERTMGAWDHQSPAQRERAALRRIRATRALYPPDRPVRETH